MDIVTTSNFHATLLQGRLSVVFVPTEHIRRCSWPLLNLLLYGGCSFDENESCAMDEGHICRSVQSEMFSVVLDKDGATLFMDPNGVEMFKYADMDDLISIAPYSWRAIQIHLGPMVAEFPGVISFLSKLLAEDNISILNMSTYDTDIIYVQERDLEAAIACLQSKLSRGVHGLKEAKQLELSRSDSAHPAHALEAHDDLQQCSPPHSPSSTTSSTIVGSDQYLTVLSDLLVLVRLSKDAVRASAFGLTQLVLQSSCARDTGRDPKTPTGRTADFQSMSFWCYCETAEEISLIMDERCLSSFTEDSIIVSPDRWRAIKLSGRTYGFDETGVVAAMSGFDTETQVLNVSSFGSNVALVLDHTLEESIATLCSSLQISRVERL